MPRQTFWKWNANKNKKSCPLCDEELPVKNAERHLNEEHPDYVEYRDNLLPNFLNQRGGAERQGVQVENNGNLQPLQYEIVFQDMTGMNLELSNPSEAVKMWTPYPDDYINSVKPTMPAYTLYPTLQDMKKYPNIVEYVEEVAECMEKLHIKTGVFKIKPPEEYQPRYDAINKGYEFLESRDVTPKNQAFDRICDGAYKLGSANEYKTSVMADYRNDCERWAPVPLFSLDKEAVFWHEKRISSQKTLYGSDVVNTGTLFETKLWNLAKIKSILSYAEEQNNGVPYLGITNSYTYFGSFASAFTLHIENMDTLSLNYHHRGARKIWYFIHPEDKGKLKALLKNLYPDDYVNCNCAYRHKSLMPYPGLLSKEGIRFGRLEQEEGDFVVAFNGGFHWGFNEGWNCSEAINFGTARWYKEICEIPLELCPATCEFVNNDLTWDWDKFKDAVVRGESKKKEENTEDDNDPSYLPSKRKKPNSTNDKEVESEDAKDYSLRNARRRQGLTSIIRK